MRLGDYRSHFSIYRPTRGFAMMKRSANGNGALCMIHFVDFWGEFDDFIVLVIVLNCVWNMYWRILR